MMSQLTIVLITFWSPFKSDKTGTTAASSTGNSTPPPPLPFFPSLPVGWLGLRELAAEKAAPKMGDILRSRWCGLHGLVVQRMIKPQVLVPQPVNIKSLVKERLQNLIVLIEIWVAEL